MSIYIGVDKCASELAFQIKKQSSVKVIKDWKSSLEFEIKDCYKMLKKDIAEFSISDIKEVLSILKGTCKEFNLNFKEVVK